MEPKTRRSLLSLGRRIALAAFLSVAGVMSLMAWGAGKRWLASTHYIQASDALRLVDRTTQLCLSVIATLGFVWAIFALIAFVLEASHDKVYDEFSKKWSDLLTSKESAPDLARLG